MLLKIRTIWKVRATPRRRPPAASRRSPRRGQDGARARGEEAGEGVEDRGLARAVRADEADELALTNGEGHVLVGGEAAEALGQPLDPEERVAHRASSVSEAWRPRHHSPIQPIRPAGL
jgi:hypothetical protein